MTAYYNEIDSYAAQFLRNLISAGLIAPGIVDERSIEDVYPSDLRGFTQCHFFAGIGAWSYALRLAGWSDDRPVWTGSCPCQPFSAAGKGAGFADERHLWPSWFHLIQECSPPIIIGEEVASKDIDPWVDLVQDDLEAVDYAFGADPFPSAGVGAPHIRDRLYWVAYAHSLSCGQRSPVGGRRNSGGDAQSRPGPGGNGLSVRLADANGDGCFTRSTSASPPRHGNTAGPASSTDQHGDPRPTNGFWRDADWLLCRDAKWRPVEPGTFPLAHGAPARVGRLRSYGNAINAQAAKAFIECVMDVMEIAA